MPPPTPDESSANLVANKMSILICLMGLFIVQTLDDTLAQAAKQPKNDPIHANSPPRTAGKVAHIMKLPVELLMPIFQHLAPSNVQPYLQGTSLHSYKQAQKDLRSVCLVSKHMDAVARRYLYQGVIISDADTLAYFLRTLGGDQALGQAVKQLVFEVPRSMDDEQYRKPNVAILESRANFEELRIADTASDLEAYRRSCLADEERWSRLGVRNWPRRDSCFQEWAWAKECGVFHLMLYEVLLRTCNIESFYFGMIHRRYTEASVISGYDMLDTLVRFSVRSHASESSSPWIRKPIGRFLSKLTQLQLVGDSEDCNVRDSSTLLEFFDLIASLRTIKFFRDDGNWYFPNDFNAQGVRREFRFDNITCLDLQRSRSGPLAISKFSTAFPSLERLSLSTDSVEIVPYRDYRYSLSGSLAKLTRLRELVLDVHYYGDVKACLGPHGTINLADLGELVSLRLPLYFLVEMQRGRDPFVPNLAVALPPSLKHLTVWANMDCVRRSKVTAFADPFKHTATDRQYHPRESAVEFFEAVHSRVADHFRHLDEVTYCYGDQELRADCHCDGDIPCNRCEALSFLDPYAVDASSAKMHFLSSKFEDAGVRLRITEEQV